MRRRLIPLGVVVLGLLVGAAVAGLPTTVASDVEANAIPTIESTTTSRPAPTTTTEPPTTTSSTTATTPAPTSPSTTSSSPAIVAPPQDPTSSATATTTAVAGGPSSAVPATGAPEARNDVRIIVGNATGQRALATWVASELRFLGYTDVLPDDATDNRQTSVVLYAPGFEADARRLAAQRGVADIRPAGREPQLTRRDEDSDLWLLVGAG